MIGKKQLFKNGESREVMSKEELSAVVIKDEILRCNNTWIRYKSLTLRKNSNSSWLILDTSCSSLMVIWKAKSNLCFSKIPKVIQQKILTVLIKNIEYRNKSTKEIVK